jgi:uncharacterized membrane protein (DUF485 family)
MNNTHHNHLLLNMKRKIHGFAGILAMIIISSFWLSSVLIELFGTPHTIAWVKHGIVIGMGILVPLLIITAISGRELGKTNTSPLASAKQKRMPLIAFNGLFILVPSAIYLDRLATEGKLDTLFYIVQGIELTAGAINLVLLGLSAKQGFQISKNVSQQKLP